MITVIAGGVGAARFLTGLLQVVDPADVTAIVNVGDDLELHGLYICPDLDTVTYTLAGAIDPERGWGLAGESWKALEMVRRYGGIDWFNLGDRDIGTHLFRTHRRTNGAPLSMITREITAAWDLGLRIIPASDDRLRTRVTTAAGEISFQEYFVKLRHDVTVQSVRFDGTERARPAPGVIDAIRQADLVVIAPSNPIVSIGPILAIAGVRAAIEARRSRCVAISPIVAGAALKGPADRLLRELGHDPSVVGVARLYRDLARVLVIDEADRAHADSVRATGVEPSVTDTIMSSAARSRALAQHTLAAV